MLCYSCSKFRCYDMGQAASLQDTLRGDKRVTVVWDMIVLGVARCDRGVGQAVSLQDTPRGIKRVSVVCNRQFHCRIHLGVARGCS